MPSILIIKVSPVYYDKNWTNKLKRNKMRVRTHDGKEGTVVERKTNQVLVKFNNGTVKGYRPEQVQEMGTPVNSLKPPSRDRDALISKYQSILDECRNEGAKAILVMILNDLR